MSSKKVCSPQSRCINQVAQFEYFFNLYPVTFLTSLFSISVDIKPSIFATDRAKDFFNLSIALKHRFAIRSQRLNALFCTSEKF